MHYGNDSAYRRCSGYIRWKQRRKKSLIRNGLMFLAITAFIAVVIFAAGTEGFSVGQLIFGAFVLLLFGFIGVKLMIQGFRVPAMEAERFWMGVILETRKNLRKKGKVKNYSIIADVGGKTMEGICSAGTYMRAEPGDEILLFSFPPGRIFCTHPDAQD